METRERVNELMKSIRRNTEPSECINVFERLLLELSDVRVVNSAMSDMHSFITEAMTLFKDIDIMESKVYKSRMLTYEFIQPERFFKTSLKLAASYYEVSKKKGMGLVLGKRNRLGDVLSIRGFSDFDFYNDREEIRRVILLWNYMPAIVKAIIQTKRRRLGLDQNSKKFGK